MNTQLKTINIQTPVDPVPAPLQLNFHPTDPSKTISTYALSTNGTELRRSGIVCQLIPDNSLIMYLEIGRVFIRPDIGPRTL